MKDITLNIVSSCKSLEENKKGYYTVEMMYKGVVKYLKGEAEHTTSNKLLIMATIDAVQRLKEPCNITVCTPTYIGIGKIKTKGGAYKESSKTRNKAELNQLREKLESGGHLINNVVTGEHKYRLKKYIKFIKSN